MRIIIDGDACPAKHLIKELALRYQIEVHVFVDSSHYFTDDYFQIHVVSKGKDAVDMALIPFIEPNDVIITQDYGVATMALGKTKHIINPLGFLYTQHNIDELLFKRYIGQKARRSGKSGTKNKKRTKENDEKLIAILERILSTTH